MQGRRQHRGRWLLKLSLPGRTSEEGANSPTLELLGAGAAQERSAEQASMPKFRQLAVPQGNEKALSPALAYPNTHSLGWLEGPAFGAGLDFDLVLSASCPDGKVILGTSQTKPQQ